MSPRLVTNVAGPFVEVVDKHGRTELVTLEVHGVACPCGGSFSIGTTSDGSAEGSPTMLHSDPACADFDELDPVTYITRANDHLAASRGPEAVARLQRLRAETNATESH
jgi:hypothetical protein